MEVDWENQSMEICREQLGESAFRERVLKNSKNKDGLFTGGKLGLSISRADAKKLITSETSLYRRYHSVGASGYAVVLKNDRIPSNDFFQPGRRFRVRFRHSNLGLEDDAGSCVREAAVKFADQNEDGPLDLIFRTGRTALTRNSRTLVKVLKAKNTTEDLRSLCHTDPYFYFSWIDGLRRCPSSFSNLIYHTQLAYQFRPKGEGEPRIARFRLVPCTAENHESGLLVPYEQTKPWVTKRRNAEKRSRTYLRDEYIKRLHQDDPVKYRIQIQFATDKESAPWNPQKMWSEDDSPWIDLIAIKLTTYLPVRTLSRTYFNIVEKPQCLEFPSASSPQDFLSYQKTWCDIYTMWEIQHVNQMDVRDAATDSPVPSDVSISDQLPYTVTICSAAIKDSGVPKVDLYLTLIGTESRTTPVFLEKRLEMKERRRKGVTLSGEQSPSEHFHEEMFEIEAERVGILLAIVLAVRHRQLTDDWYLKYVILSDSEGKKSRFPCHNVVNADVVLRTGDVCLRQKEKFEVHRQERLFELCERRHRYPWAVSHHAAASPASSTASSPEVFSEEISSTELSLSSPVASTSTAGDVTPVGGYSEAVARSLPCGHIKARTVDQLPSTERMHAAKFTGLRWEVDLKLVEFFRTLNFSNTTTGGKMRSKAWIRENPELKLPRRPAAALQSVGTVRKFSTMRQFSVLPSSSSENEEECTGNRAMARWKQLRHAIQVVNDAKIPDGSKGEMCRTVRSDSNFGRLFLAGPHPLMIRRCQVLPQNFPVTQTMVDGLLERTKRLNSEMQNGYVYIADYAVLRDIQTIHKDADHRYMVAPLVLFYVRTSGDFVPLAIQLQQNPRHSNPIWTSKDRSESWILVKLWVRCADFQMHFAVSHIFKCHTLMEPFVVATMRQLPAPHPVYKLLKRHFRCFLVTNTQLRCNMLHKGSPVEKFTSLGVKGFKSLVKNYLGQFTFNEMFPLRDFEARGVGDEQKLPNYFYRDDATRLWTAMRTYVEEILLLYYTEESDLENDEEIQSWIRGIHEFGFPHFSDQQRQGLPRTFTNLDELVEIVTMIMFTLTCSHSATHSDALDLYGILPDAPAMMRQPPPSDKKKDVTREDFAAILPDQFPDAYYGSLAFAMLVYEPDENVLAHSTEGYFTEAKAVVVVERFRAAIKQINVTIRARNSINRFLYENLLPEAIPLSAEPIPFVPRKTLKKTLVLGPEMTRELMFGGGQSANGIRATMPCMALPIGVQFANTLRGRSFIARRPGGFDMIKCAEEEQGSDVIDGGGASAPGTTSSSSSRVMRSISLVAEHVPRNKSVEERIQPRSRLCSSDV